MAWAAWAVPAAASVVSGILGKKGADKQAAAAKVAADNAERARFESSMTLSNPQIYNTGSWLFPGLLNTPNTTGVAVTGSPAAIPGGKPRSAPAGLGTAASIWGARAEGGPIEEGGSYLVGEKGPETVIPEDEGDEAKEKNAKGALSDEMIAEIVQIVMMLMQGGMGGGAGAGMEPPMPGAEAGAMPTEGLPTAPESMPMEEGMTPSALPGRAAGGPVQAGKPYVVGEQGPEVIQPAQAGTVLPNPGRPGGPPPRVGGPMQAPPQGPQAGATAGPGAGQQAPAFNTPGEAYTGWTNYFLNNPGSISPAGYERQQEQANQQQNTGMAGVVGGLSGQGVDPNSALGGALGGAVTAAAGKQRSEAARDFTMQQDQTARQDIQQALNNYLQALQLTFGIQQNRAAAAGGQAFPQVQIGNPYSGLAAGVSQLGYGLGQYFDQRNQQQSQQPSNPAPGWRSDDTH